MYIFLVFLLFIGATNTFKINQHSEIQQTLYALKSVTNFFQTNYEELNFDALLGITIGEAQLTGVLGNADLDPVLRTKIKRINNDVQIVGRKIRSILPKNPPKIKLLAHYLLNPGMWKTNRTFNYGDLIDLEYNEDWTRQTLLKDTSASYKGVPTDVCLVELLTKNIKNCTISPFCQEMMLELREDTGYLLSHRLLYLQASRMTACSADATPLELMTNAYCSLMLREAKTNQRLGFPAHDIFIEQVVLCGIEGYAEFLNTQWRKKILEWQTQYGCYKNQSEEDISKRTANIISYGCSDHTTGLAFAALALNLEYLLSENALNKLI